MFNECALTLGHLRKLSLPKNLLVGATTQQQCDDGSQVSAWGSNM